MKLNRTEGALLTAVVLGWATIPLVLHFGLPQYAPLTGPIMLAGMLVAGVLLLGLLFRVARRLDRECQELLAVDGFEVIPLTPDRMPDWIPMEHRTQSALRFSGFRNRQGHRTGYQRDGAGYRLSLYSYTFYRNRYVFTVARFEMAEGSWPAFSCAVGSRLWSQIHPIDGWERIRFEADPEFSKSCWLQTPQPDRVTPLFSTPARRIVLEHPEFRIFASGPVLMLYRADDHLVPEAAETFIAQAGAFAAELARHLRES